MPLRRTTGIAPGTVYILETWDPSQRRYVEQNRWGDREQASITFHKPYWRHVTRRLLKVSVSVDLAAMRRP